MLTTAAPTSIIEATAAARVMLASDDRMVAVHFEYPTPYGIAEAVITRDDVAKAEAHGLI